MVMVSPRLNPQACWEFDSEILVLHHPTTISVKYQAMGTILHLCLTFCSIIVCFFHRFGYDVGPFGLGNIVLYLLKL